MMAGALTITIASAACVGHVANRRVTQRGALTNPTLPSPYPRALAHGSAHACGTAMNNVANRNSKVWHGATENGP
jgi:hypothetical protein